MLKIGVTSCFFAPDPSRKVFGPKWLNYLERDMARYLSRDFVMPILIPDLPKPELHRFIDSLDGVVFQGGSDIAPQNYGEIPIENGRWPGDPDRDAYELEIMGYAIKEGKPVYGICRGFQLMNVYFGGTLYQDIETQHPLHPNHRDAQQYDQLHHEIRILPGTLLERLHKDDPSRTVNTVHHQGIKDLGKDLEVQALSAGDELIEAFLWKGAAPGRVIGVQWHPEFAYNSPVPHVDPYRVYDCFLGFCANVDTDFTD